MRVRATVLSPPPNPTPVCSTNREADDAETEADRKLKAGQSCQNRRRQAGCSQAVKAPAVLSLSNWPQRCVAEIGELGLSVVAVRNKHEEPWPARTGMAREVRERGGGGGGGGGA